jgi:hypothetical protein
MDMSLFPGASYDAWKTTEPDDDPPPSRECSCDPDHSITKLGHCSDCPHYNRGQVTAIEHALGRCLCWDSSHIDGTEHDFEWATYSDECVTTGVCRCGVREIDYMITRLP